MSTGAISCGFYLIAEQLLSKVVARKLARAAKMMMEIRSGRGVKSNAQGWRRKESRDALREDIANANDKLSKLRASQTK
uniref:Uncharacterized protein n=1 Tax=Salmonella sp. TaxID=599 RepID=A0A482ETU4_SALSP|nr:hypothetical protein [Salmonella sp.]QBM91466.1 hypothetical protein NNIBIDOC_00137 [Salmonella sp.]